jgi:hypothetical protein
MPHTHFHKTLSIEENDIFGAAPPLHGVRYHQQDFHPEEMLCGAAAAQIVLNSIGVPLANLDQNDLYTSHKAHGTPDPPMTWFSPPDGLTTTLNRRKPPSFSRRFELCEFVSVDAISRKLCWTIQNGVAPIALVDNGTHWIVVVGFEASAEPTGPNDTSYVIKSFDVFNPWPFTPPGKVPPPHAHQSDNCGTGFSTGKDRGDRFETIFYDATAGSASKYWSTFYMTKVPRGRWKGKLLSVCIKSPGEDVRDGESTDDPTDDVLLTDPVEIQNRASAGLDSTNQMQRSAWRVARDGTHVGDPTLVEREDFDPSRFYYIVPFQRDSALPILTFVDAYQSGSLADTVAVPDGTTHFAHTLNREAVLHQFAGQQVDIGGEVVTLAEQDIYPHLIWRPCAESLSPYWPFYRFDVGGQESGIKVYVRIDGELFTELHIGFGM